MKGCKLLLPSLVVLFLCGAGGQVYQSKDAQGNTVYSDKPTQGAEAIKVQMVPGQYNEDLRVQRPLEVIEIRLG